MSFVSASDGGTDNAGNRSVRWDDLSNLDPGQTKELTLTLRVDDATQGDFRNWAEITDDSSEDFNTTDEDSTPDIDRGDDDAPGFGTGPNDDVDNHNDITLDNPANDEDDNDFEDISVEVSYDLALIKTLGNGQSSTAVLGDRVVYLSLIHI